MDERLVRVQLLLAGGVRHEFEAPEDSPLLRALLEALVARLVPAAQGGVLFQLPTEAGRSAFTFTSDQLVAIETTPPVLAGTEAMVVTPELLGRVPGRYVRYENVLGTDARERLLDAAIARIPELQPSQVTTNVAGYRRSRVEVRAGELAAELVALVRARLSELCRRLEVPPFPVAEIETQLTLHNDGDYFRVHTDAGDEGTRTREISYVYYFHRQPKRFEGGELVLFDTRTENGQPSVAGPPIVVEPLDNSLVVFRSSCLHEVRPVRSLTDDPADGRFTINGWVRRSDAGSAG